MIMNNADRPIAAIYDKNGFPQRSENLGDYPRLMGLSKREHFAGLAIQTLISDSSLSPSEASRLAIDYADALLAELDK